MDAKTRIINAAIEVFAEKGKYGARMEEIAAKAEINKAMLYYYYTSKDLLFKEVLRTILHYTGHRIARGIEQAIENTDNIIEKITGLIKIHYESFSQNTNYTKVLLNALSNEPEDIREVAEIVLRSPEIISSRKQMETVFEEGISRNVLRNVDIAQFLISMIGTNLIYFIAKPIAELQLDLVIDDEQTFLRKREQSVVRLLLYGILNRDDHDKQGR